jgi:hypothetical protein
MHRHVIAIVTGVMVIAVAPVRLFAGHWIPGSQTSNASADMIDGRSTSQLSNQASAAETCPQTNLEWKQYIAPNREFSIRYPSSTHAETSQERNVGLVSRTSFKFNQAFDVGGGNKGFIRFDFQGSVWRNPNRLSAETWAKRGINPALISDAGALTVSNAKGYSLRKSDLASWSVDIFVARSDRMYEISYLDIVTDDTLISSATRECWKTVLDKMVDSFTLLQTNDLPPSDGK